MVYQYNFPTTIRFGKGAINEAPQVLQGKSRPILITDRNIESLDFIQDIKKRLTDKGFQVGVFADMGGNPVENDVAKGLLAYHQHQADAILMVGGGATLDVGKAIALMVNHPGHLFDYEDGKPDARPTTEPFPFMVAVPTTAGTGSEVGRSSVISHNETKEKKIIFSPKMLPNIVLADPELTFGLPPLVTAATGLDALTHLLEAYLAKGFHPMCDGIALEGIRLVANSLQQAVNEPHNLEARGHMLIASLMGAVAFQKGLGINHSCAHALSTVFDLHHGLANALMLPACMDFNREAVPEKFETLATTLGLGEGAAVQAWLSGLIEATGIQLGLKNHQVELTDRLVAVALSDVCHPSGPRPVKESDIRNLFETAL